ncbi:TATA-binding protein-associated factor mot1, partial [Physocladia obscura]
MTTRLDRLVLLLDTGSTAIVRNTAAQQIGEVQRQHPDELYSLLARVLVHLRSRSWDTRTAAGAAIAAIAANVAPWEPGSVAAANTASPMAGGPEDDTDRLSFATFDIGIVIRGGAPLVSSAGAEFDVDFSGMDGRERLAYQKKLVKARLGMETEIADLDLVNDSDLKAARKSPAGPTVKEEVVPKQLLEIGKTS